MSHQPRKRFGQHFLHDRYVIDQMVTAISPQKNDHLVEIGPGQGALTFAVLPLVDDMDAIELDRDLIPLLQQQSHAFGKLHLHQGDALKFNFHSLVKQDQKLRLIGNLPYNISSPILFHLLDQVDVINDMHFMLQKEVAQRLAATPNSAHYSRLSVMVQYDCKVELLFEVSPHSFTPAPKVDSAVVRLIPHRPLPFSVADKKQFALVVQSAFSMRRKMLRNSLKNIISPQQLELIGINPNQRPEQLSVEDFVRITSSIR